MGVFGFGRTAKEVPKERSLNHFSSGVMTNKVGFALTHRGKTGRGNSHTVFQVGPDIYLHETPCRIIVVHGSKFADPDD